MKTKEIYNDYISQIAKCNFYNEQEEREIFERYNLEKNEKLRNEIFNHYILLVTNRANRYREACNRHSGIDIMDLIAEGNLALLHAIDKFDVNEGTRFTSYATRCIDTYISRYFYQNKTSVYIPIWANEQMVKINRLINEKYPGKSIKTLPIETIKEIIDVPDSHLELFKNIPDVNSLECSLFESDEENYALHPINNDITDFDKIDDLLDKEQLWDYLYILLKDEMGKEKNADKYLDILKCRMGYDGEIWTLEEIANKYECSKEAIRKIEQRCIQYFRHPMYKAKVKEKFM